MRKPYERQRSAIDPIEEGWEPTKTVQCDTTDINTIVERFKRTGIMPGQREGGQYGDVSELQGKDLGQLLCERDLIEIKIAKAQREAEAKRAAEAAQKQAEEPGVQKDAPETATQNTE